VRKLLQEPRQSDALKYNDAWLGIGLAGIVLLFYLSFTNLSVPQVAGAYGDKVNHLLAYGCLMGWFGQIYKRTVRLGIAVVLVLVGLVIEVVQGQLGHRWFDLQDALANTLGVGGALLLLFLGADRILHWLEQHMLRLQGH